MNADFPEGLSQTAAAKQLATDGPNELGTEQQRTLWAISLEVIREPMFLLLLGAGGIYLTMGNTRDALILLGFVFIIMGMTIFQERRTEHALEALRDLSSPRALVIRDGQPIRIAGRDVVRGDVLMLAEGDRIPADGDVLQAHELAADESMLTGESESVAKFTMAENEDAAKHQVFAGTLLVGGQGVMRVTATGKNTSLGQIGKSLQDISIESSPLRDEMGRLTKQLALIGIGLCLLLSALYWALRGSALDALLAGITLAMSILPQEFPVIMIVFLAMGARRIATQHVLTRRLNAIETLGETTVLCTDKTGTLTENRMAVAGLWIASEAQSDVFETSSPTAQTLSPAPPEAYHSLLEYLVLASEIEPHDPMELAFHRFANQCLANTEHLHPDWSLAREYELSPALLAMSHVWRNTSGEPDVVASKGAPEAIARLCKLTADEQKQIADAAQDMAARGWRVLGVAHATHPVNLPWPAAQEDFNFNFIGLVALADPIRAEVPGAIAECHRAGIRVLMITGDHPGTAQAIARQAGITQGECLTGPDLARLDAAALAKRIGSVNVFARVSPQQKLVIVEALKANGDVVAMTGDGVNDAPALKAAHIGIAMGKRGTDVAREAAALVLLEDDFTAIVAAIKLGRRIFANLRQALVYTFAVHIPIIGLTVLPVLFGLPLVLAPIHIAFLELVIDPACSLVFEAEKGSEGLMSAPPRPLSEPLLSWRNLLLSFVQGGTVTLLTALFYVGLLSSKVMADEARTLAFITLVTANALLIIPSRSARPSGLNMFAGLSRVGLLVLGGTLAGLLLITLQPNIATAFSFKPPALQHWLLAFTLGAAMLIVFEGAKRVLNKPA